MPLNETELSSLIKTELDKPEHMGPSPTGPDGSDDPNAADNYRKKFCDAIAKAVVKHIKDTLVITGATVKIPAGEVITSVSGGSGAPALGVPNDSEIECLINFNDDPDRLA